MLFDGAPAPRDGAIRPDLSRPGLGRARLRGEVRPGALSQRVVTVGPTLLRQHFMLHGDIPEATIGEIVDEVVLPLVRVPPP